MLFTTNLRLAITATALIGVSAFDFDRNLRRGVVAASIDTIHRDNPRELSPARGTSIKALVLLIRFSNHVDRVLPNVTYYEDLCNNKMAPYLKQQSYNVYQFTCHVEDWFTTQNTEAYYAQGESGLVGQPAIQDMFRPKLDALDATTGGGVGSLEYWGQFDSDMDGTIDSLMIFHSGYPAEFPGDDCETGAAAINRIFSQGHPYAKVPGGWQSADGNFQLSGVSVNSGLTGTCNGNPAGMGIATHEHIHTFNAFGNGTNPIDLYDRTTGSVGGVGGFDIMSNPFGPISGPGDAPGSMGPFSKMLADWMKPIDITSDGTYTASPSTTAPDYYRIGLGPSDEYLILEYRVPVSFDANFFGSGGLIIWHIDRQAEGQAKRGFPGQSGWPQNGNHYMVAIAQKDGLYEIEQGINIGDEGDLFIPGDSLGPNTDGNTYPNTDSYQGGNIVPSGITITVESMDIAGLTFTVAGMGTGGGPMATRSPVAAPTEPVTLPAPAPVTTPPSSSSPPDLPGAGDGQGDSSSASRLTQPIFLWILLASWFL